MQTPLAHQQLWHPLPTTEQLLVRVPTLPQDHHHTAEGEASMKKISERNMRLTIAMMRSMANCKPISPFHLEASKEMEAMLEELLALRKKLKEKQ
jgi:hypothetical protein